MNAISCSSVSAAEPGAAGGGYSIRLRLTPVAAVRHVPALVRPLLSKARGWARLKRRAAKLLFQLLHRRLGLPARGAFLMDPARRALPFAPDFANTAYLDFAVRAEGYEPEVSALLQHLAPRLKQVYDIGANWGYYSALLAAAPAFQGRIDAFEIAPGTFRDLTRMLNETGYAAKVHCHPVGLSDRAGQVAIAEGLHSFLTRVAEDGRGRKVSVTTLDAADLPDPDLIKIDVEGHEAHVLRGGQARLARAKPLIVFENWPDQEEPLRILSGLGYRFLRLAWSTEQDGAGTLSLIPLPPAERPRFAGALNLLAAHPANDAVLRAAFG